MSATSPPGPAFPPDAFRRIDETADTLFYASPRFVTHLDARALAAVTDLYRTHFPAEGTILDLMSSWVSHLPPELRYRRVVGHGLNAEELAANPRLDEWFVQDLNETPALPLGTAEFDGAALCASFQYLTRPVAVLREVGRVLRPGAPLVVTFSNRCFPTKAVALWQALPLAGCAGYVVHCLRESRAFGRARAAEILPEDGAGDPLWAVVAPADTP